MTNSEQHKKNNTRVFLLATAIALLILVNGGFAYWQMNQVKAEFYEVANRDLPLAQELLPLIDRQFVIKIRLQAPYMPIQRNLKILSWGKVYNRSIRE